MATYQIDPRSLSNIATLLPEVQPVAREHLERIHASGLLPKGYHAKITSAYRSPEEQNRLYAQGRTVKKDKDGNRLRIVTNARAWQSGHQFRFQYDITIFDDKGRPVWDSALYKKILHIGREMGLECGGDWPNFPDLPHYGMPCDIPYATLRIYVREGRKIPLDPLKPATSKKVAVQIFDGVTDTGIKGKLIAGRVWVPLRPFIKEFGGAIAKAEADRFIIALNGEQIELQGMNIGGHGWVKFAELNRLHDFQFTYARGILNIFP